MLKLNLQTLLTIIKNTLRRKYSNANTGLFENVTNFGSNIENRVCLGTKRPAPDSIGTAQIKKNQVVFVKYL